MADKPDKYLNGYEAVFDTIHVAAGQHDLVLMHCRWKATGKDVAVVAAVNWSNKENPDYELVPLAALFDGNPYEMLYSPDEVAAQDEERAKMAPALRDAPWEIDEKKG